MSIRVDLGETFVNGGQEYRVVGYRDYIKADGSRAVLTELSSHCAQCGAEFITRAVREDGYLNRRCDEHKRPGAWTRKQR